MSYVVLFISYPKNNKELKLETSADRKSRKKVKEKENTLTHFKNQLYLIAKSFGDKINQSQVIT